MAKFAAPAPAPPAPRPQPIEGVRFQNCASTSRPFSPIHGGKDVRRRRQFLAAEVAWTNLPSHRSVNLRTFFQRFLRLGWLCQHQHLFRADAMFGCIFADDDYHLLREFLPFSRRWQVDPRAFPPQKCSGCIILPCAVFRILGFVNGWTLVLNVTHGTLLLSGTFSGFKSLTNRNTDTNQSKTCFYENNIKSSSASALD